MGAKQEAEGWGATRVRWGPPGGRGWRRGAGERAGRGDPGLQDVERGSSAAGCTGPGPRDRSENCRLGEPLKRTGRQAGLGDRATSSVYRQETEAHRGGPPPPRTLSPQLSIVRTLRDKFGDRTLGPPGQVQGGQTRAEGTVGDSRRSRARAPPALTPTPLGPGRQRLLVAIMGFPRYFAS